MPKIGKRFKMPSRKDFFKKYASEARFSRIPRIPILETR